MHPRTVQTPYGPQELLEGTTDSGLPAHVIHRHGLPHARLPHQVNFRAQAWALRQVGCGALVLNSSVGVLVEGVPLFAPLLATDLLMPENRLPDGSLCTLFTDAAVQTDREVRKLQGHLVLRDGIFSGGLAAQLRGLAPIPREPDPLVFVYAPGPRTKTPAENRFWAASGGQVNSMSVGPEAVLAAEAGIPCAALLVGHKRSGDSGTAPGREALARSLDDAREATESILLTFLRLGTAVSAENLIYRFDGPPRDP
ncbi:5'-methylthioadenosine phosphorylase [soil metagenome]